MTRVSAIPKLSAIVACYQDAQAVPHMHQRLEGVFRLLGVDYEIVFVNDGSPDDTRQVLAMLVARDPHVIAVNHTRNFGSQNAFTSGMKVATGDAVILLDGDLQDPPEVIEEFFAKWQEGYDVVYGVRVKREGRLFLKLAYKFFYRIFRATSYVAIPIDAGDFSLLDRRVVDVMNALPENNRFLRGLRAWVGFRQTGVPYHRPERMFGRSTNSLLRNVGWARKAIFSFSYAPIDAISWLGLLICASAFFLIALQVVLRLIEPSLVPPGLTTVLIVILFIGGIQLLSLSVIGSYIAHVYDEVKRRPAYLVESILRHDAPPAGETPANGRVPGVQAAETSEPIVLDADSKNRR